MSDVQRVDPTIKIRAETLLADPDACKFTVSRTVHLGGPFFFDDRKLAAGSPLPERLFALPGVAYVLVADDVVTVGKEPSTSWTGLKSAIGTAIRTQLLTGVPAILEAPRIEFDQAGWAIANPNRPRPTIGSPLPIMPVGPSSPAVGSRPPADLKADLSGGVAQRVMMVLDRQINPSIAVHGGHAELVAVEEDTAYLRLSGGCQGCGMATVTLGQGIEVAIKEHVPEITRVLDVTDHASGTSPYFEAAKK